MNRIILIGYMGSGKTTLGKKLANKLGVPFYDSDKMIEEKEGASIADLFVNHGEAYFRERERELIRQFSAGEFVLATGGGLPCFFDNMEKLNRLGHTIYLRRSPAEIAFRLKHAKVQRPLLMDLTEDELLPFVSNKIAERELHYLHSKTILHRDEQSVDGILNALLPQFQKN